MTQLPQTGPEATDGPGPSPGSSPPTGTEVAVACPECDYDLRGITAVRCPWCGWTIDPEALTAAAHERTFSHRRGIVVAALAFGLGSLVGIAALVRPGRGLGVVDGFTVVAIIAAGFAHLTLAAIAFQSRGRWPMRPGEAAGVLRFVGWFSIAAAVIGASAALHPPASMRAWGGIPISGALEFVLRAGLQALPGCVLLVLRLCAFRASGGPGSARPASRVTESPRAPFTVGFRGRYTREQVTCTWHDTPRSTTAANEADLAAVWEAEQAVARQEGRTLYNGALARLIRAHVEPGGLRLDLGPTCYRDFLGTNLNHAGRTRAVDASALADPVGVSAIVVTSDGFLTLGRRSHRVAYHGGLLHPFGGMLEQADRIGGTFDVFAAVLREIREETGLRAAELADPVLVALVRDRAIHQPELLFDVEVQVAREQLAARFAALPLDQEHTAVEFVADDPDAALAFLSSAEVVTPVGQAAILLHGFRSWGTAWYEQTCYLAFGDLPPSA